MSCTLARQLKNRARPGLEVLEERRLLAAGITLNSAGLLQIQGTENADRITVRYTEDTKPSKVVATIEDASTGTLILRSSFDSSAVKDIKVQSLGGDDSVHNITNITSTLNGGKDNDYLEGGSNNDRLEGDVGNDRLWGKLGDDVLVGGPDNDIYALGNTSLAGSYADATLPAGLNLGRDVVDEVFGEGEDTLTFFGLDRGIRIDLTSYSEQSVTPNLLAVTLTSGKTIENVEGTNFDDVIRGNSLANELSGYDGKDVLEGRGGDDTLAGGADDDTYVFSGTGNLGSDLISEPSYYSYYGRASGSDTLDFTSFGRAVTIRLPSSGRSSPWEPSLLETVSAGYLTVQLVGRFENVIGTAYNDTITGNELENRLEGLGGNDILRGGSGIDHLDGGLGYDQLYGEGDDDTLDGGSDHDRDDLWGGEGADTFVRYFEPTQVGIFSYWTSQDYALDFTGGLDVELAVHYVDPYPHP